MFVSLVAVAEKSACLCICVCTRLHMCVVEKDKRQNVCVNERERDALFSRFQRYTCAMLNWDLRNSTNVIQYHTNYKYKKQAQFCV